MLTLHHQTYTTGLAYFWISSGKTVRRPLLSSHEVQNRPLCFLDSSSQRSLGAAGSTPMSTGIRCRDYRKGKRKGETRQREKRKISPVLGPAMVQSAEGSSPSGLAHLGLQFVSFYPPCPSFGRALELIRLIRCHEQLVSLWDLGFVWGVTSPSLQTWYFVMYGELSCSAYQNSLVNCPAQLTRTGSYAPSGMPSPSCCWWVADLLLFTCGSLLGRVPCYAEFVIKQNLPHHNVWYINSFSLSHCLFRGFCYFKFFSSQCLHFWILFLCSLLCIFLSLLFPFLLAVLYVMSLKIFYVYFYQDV